MRLNSKAKIAIIGAGAAGLTVAETLQSKGYTNITIIEKENRAGGKCCSVEHKGRSYELGAGIVAENNKTVLSLVKKFNIQTAQAPFGGSTFFTTAKGMPVIKKMSFKKKIFLLWQLLIRYRRLSKRHKTITEPGLSSVNSGLCEPFSVWAERHKISLVAEAFAPFFTGFGYGYFDEIPAGYVLKYYSWATIKSFVRRAIYIFPHGIQQLWTAVAKNHNILYNTNIKSIKRDAVVTIETERSKLQFDALILACPLDESLNYLDASSEEKSLFSKILYYDYRTYACFLKNFPPHNGYLYDNFFSSRNGHPLFWYQRYADSNLYTFYVIGDWEISNDKVIENIRNLVSRLGGSVEGVHTIRRWKYFPHITSENMKNGYFDKLENLQGKNNTYYAGELLNFSTVGLSAEYAEKLIKTHF